jgi:hypothetical protein
MVADQSGSCSVTVKAATFPTAPTASITGGTDPTLAGLTATDAGLGAWTCPFAANTTFRFGLTSPVTITRLLLELTYTRS